MTRSCSLQKLLADLGVNVILVITLAKHCSYIYNLDSYCFKIVTLNSQGGGQKVFKGGRMPPPPPPPKRNPADIKRYYMLGDGAVVLGCRDE